MKDNKLIAEFMGIKSYEASGYTNFVYSEDNHRTEVDLAYHDSWNWLMPVVEKIESDERYDVDILQYGTRIRDNQKEIVTNVADISFNSKIDHTYDAVVRFLKRLTDET